MGKKFLLWVCLFLQFNSSIQAQMRRIIRPVNAQQNATVAQSATITNNVLTCSIDTILLTTQAQIDNFSANYPTCTNPKYLIIDGAGASPAITNLNGLSSLTAIQNKLVIKNTSITTLSAINNITSIADTLQIDNNPNLATLGLTNLTSFGTLILNKLPALTSVAGFSTNLNKIGSINIDSTGITTLAGFSNIDSLITPFETFSITYTPITTLSTWTDLKQVNGYMWLENLNALTSIGISNLQQCWGFLYSNLPALNNLGNISYHLTDQNTGTFWFINTGLTTLAGMDSIKAASNFYVSGNNNLTTIQGLQNIAGNVGGISIYGNPLLTSIAPLSNITSANNDATIEVSYNNALTSLNGLQNITNIGKGLWIAGNDNLTNLYALNNNLTIQNNPDSYNGIKDSVRIYDNSQLAICSDTSICNYLSGAGAAFIDNNAVGCNTIAEIQSSCSVVTINCNDIEPNDNDVNAISLSQNLTKCGHVGYQTGVDGNNDPVYDEFDVYKIVMPYFGSINIDFTAKNDSSCFSNSNTNLDLTVLDANFNDRHGESLFQWNSTDTCNSEKTKSIKLRGYAGEEFYLRLNGSAITYTLNWHASDQATSEPEYNGDYANAIYLNPSDTVRGLINYISAYQYDNADFYKTKMPVTGNVRVHVKVKNRQNYDPGVPNGIRFTWKFDNFNSSVFYLPTGNEDDSASQDIDICGIKNDTVYFKIEQQSEANEYQWSYEIIDTLNVTDNYEPNNTLATGTQIAENEIKTATVNFMGNVLDFYDSYKTKIPKSGSIRFKVTATDTKCNHGNFIVKAYNINNNQIFGKTFTSTGAPGAVTTFTDSANICGINANDSIYFQITSTDPFSYSFSYKMVDTIENIIDIEPNNSFATATQLNMGDSIKGRINYPTTADADDYYKTVMPYSGNVKIIVESKNIDCFSGAAVLWVYDRRKESSPLPFFPINNIPSQQTRRDTFNVCGLAADTLYFRMNSNFNTKLQYKIRYEITDTTTSDVEDNGSFALATTINEQQQKSGTIHYSNGAGTDTYDYYKTMLPYDGTLKIMVQATNMSCANSQWLYLYGYDRRQASGQIFGKYLANNSNIAAGQTIYDTIIICGRAADSFYLRFEASKAFKYQWSYVMIDTSANDIEPNNDFATALPIAELQTKVGHLKYASNGGTDDYDFYKTLLPKDGTLKIMVQATNMSCANGQYLYLRGYDKRQGGGEILSRYLGNNSSISAGQTVYDTILICGRAVDSFYLRFEASNAAFKYQWSYTIVDTSLNDVEPNGSFAQAIAINENESKVGHLRYASNGGTDDYDFYKTLLPKDGTLKIMVQATNMSCANGQYLYLRGYDKRQGSGEFLSRYLGNNSSISAGQTVYDTILICGRAVDSFYLRFEASNAAFKYQWSYTMVDTSVNDAEPNNSFATAIGVGSNQTKKGHIKYFANGVADDLDYYKFVFTTSDSLKLQMQATNTSCANGQYIYLRVYDKNFNQLSAKYFALNSSIAAGQTVLDSIKMFVTAPDTIYLRYEASNPFKYQLSSNPRTPASSFSIVGDSTTCFGLKTYKAVNVFDDNVVYHWVLSGGGTLNFTDSIATVNWNSNGTHNLSLYLSNSFGNSITKQKTIIVNNNAPTEVPVLQNFARTLSTSNLPSGSVCKWFKSGVEILGVTDSIYYTQDSGTYTVRFVRPCGIGPISNAFYFPLPAQVQTINFTHTPNIIMSLTAKAKLIAVASSGLPVSFQLISGNATIVGDSVFVTSVGTVIVKANQQGSDVYAAATAKYDTILVIQGPQSITFNTIPTQIYTTSPLALTATASSGLPVSYNIISGNATISGSNLTMTGAGNVTVQAVQTGNANYSAAAPVLQTFCIGVRNLTSINGSNAPCLNNYVYTTDKIPGANYVWTLSSGGTLTSNNDTAFINWTTTGTHTITVKANSNCDAVYSNIASLTITTANNAPAVVTNMLPVNNAINQQLPLTLSWLPGSFTVNYDLYVWDSAQVQPVTPFAFNINTVNYTIPQNSLAYNKTYKWRLVSKNPCLTTAGPIQHFRLIPLPDLAVAQVLAPSTAFSGQTISISWTVKNNGPGRTQTNQTWSDAVYLSFDTIPNFTIPAETNPGGWNQLNFPIRPLLIGSRPNVSALDSNQSYTNSINFTLPVNYSQPFYVYVITNSPANGNLPQVTYLNDTARAAQPIVVTLSPTPDLRVDTVLTTASTFSGSTVNVTFKVKNYGVVTPPNTSWYDQLYISPTANFNINNAVKLKYPKNNNAYYYNPFDALAIHSTQLNADSSYTVSLPVVIPNYILGTYFIHVVTNVGNYIYEGALSNNNTNSKQIQVFLTPTPILDVDTLGISSTNISITQPVFLNWKIKNNGFFDNIERNKGHYPVIIGDCLFITSSQVPITFCPMTPLGGSCGFYTVIDTTVGKLIQDSLGFGGSYWKDKIYISKDSTGNGISNYVELAASIHGLKNSGSLSQDDALAPGCSPFGNGLVGIFTNTINVIKPQQFYPKEASFNIPDTLSAGNYFVYVLANAERDVYEYPAINRYKRTGMITVSRPDLVPPTVTVPANVNADIPFTINYSISNAGPGNVYNHIRKDRIYVSTSPIFDGSAQIISTQTFTENVLSGSPVQHSFTYTFPPGTPTSTRYFYVHTNYDSAFKETNLTNNRSAAVATNVTIAAAKDLMVTSVQLPINITDTVFTLSNVPLRYTVTNNGADSIVGKNWIDSIFVSCSPTFNASTAYYLTRRAHNNTLAAGQNYSDSFNVTIPKFSYELNGCFGIDNTNAYFFVRTNADTGVYEGANMVNNYTASIQKKLINPYIDLIVINVSGADTATIARNYTTNWNTKNIKYYTDYGYYSHNEGIYFSPDSVFNANAILATDKYEDRRLSTNQTMSSNTTFIVPNIAAGDYYIHVKTNKFGLPAEKNTGNNTNLIRNASGAAKKIYVKATPLPDITDSIIVTPTLLAVGQSYNIKYKIKNEGIGVSYPNGMNSVVYLSPNTQPGGLVLQQTQNTNPLQPGLFYTDSVTINIPINTIPGNYVLVINADNNASIIESNETNNIAYKFVTVYSPAPADLIVQNVSHPDSVFLGYTIDSLKWIVKNNSSNNAQGISSDGLYLTNSNTFDSTATLFGIKNKTINMLPLSSDTLFAQPLVNNVTEGNYKVFVKTDFLNNIVETNKDNNTGSPVGNIYVKVKELPLNILTTNTLSNIARYYKLIIPDSLNGSTILVTLKSNDSLTSNNQMYIGKGYIPNASNFDYKYDKPNYGNQDIVITTASAGTYYIAFSKISSTVATQNVTIKAVKLPFAILTVQNGSGGNTGNVTVKISGSLFNNSMTGRLYNGTTSIPATAIYFTNSTTVYATFNLSGKPLGIYHVELRKTTDSTTATLFNGFSIVPANNGGLITGGGINGIPGNGNEVGCDPNAPSGFNSQLVAELVLPDKVFGGWIFVIQINYNNPTNVDIPAQTRVLYCTDGFPIATTQAGVASGTSSLYIELTEPGGPPGIIRAGGSGTITLYSKAPITFPAHKYGNYILK